MDAARTMDDEYWSLVERRRLSFCRCLHCGHAWLPPSPDCPRCLQPDAGFEAASGNATLLSWVVFHRAYHESVKGRVPYAVGLLQLEEGPRMVANVPHQVQLSAGQAMRLRYDGEDDTLRPGFVPSDSP